MKLERTPKGWALKVGDLSEPAWVVSNRRRAVSEAKRAATFHGAELSLPSDARAGGGHEA